MSWHDTVPWRFLPLIIATVLTPIACLSVLFFTAGDHLIYLPVAFWLSACVFAWLVTKTLYRFGAGRAHEVYLVACIMLPIVGCAWMPFGWLLAGVLQTTGVISPPSTDRVFSATVSIPPLAIFATLSYLGNGRIQNVLAILAPSPFIALAAAWSPTAESAILFAAIAAIGSLLIERGLTIASVATAPSKHVCRKCGYDLTGLRKRECPECGWRELR